MRKTVAMPDIPLAALQIDMGQTSESHINYLYQNEYGERPETTRLNLLEKLTGVERFHVAADCIGSILTITDCLEHGTQDKE